MNANRSAHEDYSDIIHLPRPISKTHPPMSKTARAAQFAPYAALVGHHDLITTNDHLAADKTDLDDTIVTELDTNYEFLTDDNYSQENPLDS